MKKYRSFQVEVVCNGFIVDIGCQQLVFKTLGEVADAIKLYEADPEGASSKMMEDSLVGNPNPFTAGSDGFGLTRRERNERNS